MKYFVALAGGALLGWMVGEPLAAAIAGFVWGLTVMVSWDIFFGNN